MRQLESERGARAIGSLLLLPVGALAILSAAVKNPWVRSMRGFAITNDREPLLHYFFLALGFGVLLILVGDVVRRTSSPSWASLGLLIWSCALVTLSDRALLARYGISVYVPDPQLHFRLRPNTIRAWPSWQTRGAAEKLIRINNHGHNDDDFSVAKPTGEVRILALGDSVTMGYGVNWQDAYPNVLERSLESTQPRGGRYQVINAAVAGYATRQEVEVLRESLRFGPDLVVIGFCMNDVTEPFVVDRELGGTGRAHQDVTQAKNALLSYFLNETGYGRWIQSLGAGQDRIATAKRAAVYDVRNMATYGETDPRLRAAWRRTLSDLDALYETLSHKQLPGILLIFPHTFQLHEPSLQRPQQILIEHASRRGIPGIDFTSIFEKLIPAGTSADLYFLDQDHLTEAGHVVVAERLLRELTQVGGPLAFSKGAFGERSVPKRAED